MNIITHVKEVLQGKHSLSQKRSNKWPEVREAHLKLQPKCEVCGGSSKLEVHHIHSFVEHPEKELDPNNLITLCESTATFNCHLIFGHLHNFQCINPDVIKDSKTWNKKLLEAKKERLERKKNAHK